MLRETYLANIKNLPLNSVRIRVARPSVLAPSAQLLREYKSGQLDWDYFTACFKVEILNNPKAIKRLQELKMLAKSQDVYLYCYEKNPPCHRFILMDIINELP